MSVIYSKAKLASACGGIIYFLSYVPYMYVAIREEVAHDKITAFEKCIAVRPFLFFQTFSYESENIWGQFVKCATYIMNKPDDTT